MRTPVRVDYAAHGHGTWLSMKTRAFDTVETAVLEAQRRMERWEPCIGFRIVELHHPEFQRMEEQDIGKIVGPTGKKMTPWEVSCSS